MIEIEKQLMNQAPMNDVTIGKVNIGKGFPIAVICGPCVIESEEIVMRIAEQINKIMARLRIPWILNPATKKTIAAVPKVLKDLG